MNIPLIAFLTIFVLTFLLNIPIPLGMIASAVSYFVLKGRDIGIVAEQMLTNLEINYVVTAVPLFVFTALVMNTGKITDKVYGFAHALVGRFRGGLAHVNILGSVIFSGMTGSAVADASGIGLMEIKAMTNAGYEAGFSCALTATTASIGPIIPPSIPMVFYAMLSGASIGSLFLGGFIPGLLMAIFLGIYVVYIARKRNYPRAERITFVQFLTLTLKAFPALLTPVILLGGIYSGVVTPTEAAALAAIYALIISIFVYRSVGWKELAEILVNTVKTTGVLMSMVAAAYAFAHIVALEHISEIFCQMVLRFTNNKYLLLLAINIMFLILGCLIDTNTITLVFIPMVLPAVQALGIDLVHFGVVIVLNMMIGLCTPPFGMLLFVVSGATGTPLKEIIKEAIPMILMLIVVLFILTYVPETVLFLPRLLGK
ncbi:MAG: TRAP transporter large permease [Bacillota bacterium]